MSEPEGAPEWIVTFSDIVSLLVTFFIMILTWSTLEVEDFDLIRGSLQGALGVVGLTSDQSSIVDRRQLRTERNEAPPYPPADPSRRGRGLRRPSPRLPHSHHGRRSLRARLGPPDRALGGGPARHRHLPGAQGKPHKARGPHRRPLRAHGRLPHGLAPLGRQGHRRCAISGGCLRHRAQTTQRGRLRRHSPRAAKHLRAVPTPQPKARHPHPRGTLERPLSHA